MRPDIAGVFVHLFLHLGQHEGDSLIREQAVAAGALVDVAKIYIPLRAILILFADIPEERVCITAGRI